MPQPADVLAIDEELQQVFRDAWDEVEAEQRRIFGDPEKYRRRARLREVQRRIEQLMNDVEVRTREWIEERLPIIYGRGAQASPFGDAFSWTQVHIPALRTIAGDMFDDVLKATRFVRRDVKRFIRQVSKERLLSKLAIGRTAVQTGREIEAMLRQRGIAAIVYRDGSRHGLREYGEMLARTKSAEAYNVGTLRQDESYGVKYWEILDGPSCGLSYHDDPTAANGLIVDRDTADRYRIAHPNCRRTFAGRPDLTTKRDVRSAKSLVSDAQNADIAQADAVRRELRRRSRLSRRGRTRGQIRADARERRLLQRQLRHRTGGGSTDDVLRVLDDAPAAFQLQTGLDAGEAVDKYIAERLPMLRESQLSRDVVHHLSEYSGAAHQILNEELRAGRRLRGENSALQTALDDIIGRTHLANSMIVFRGVDDELLHSLRIGDTFTDSGFVSTSASQRIAHDFASNADTVMEIHLKAGQHAYYNVLSEAESEIILPRGSQFRVLGLTDRPGTTIKHLVLEAL